MCMRISWRYCRRVDSDPVSCVLCEVCLSWLPWGGSVAGTQSTMNCKVLVWKVRKPWKTQKFIIHNFSYWIIYSMLLVCAKGWSLTHCALRGPTLVTCSPSKLFLSLVVEATLAKQPAWTTPYVYTRSGFLINSQVRTYMSAFLWGSDPVLHFTSPSVRYQRCI